MTSRFPLGWRLVASLILVTLWLIALYAAKVGVPFVLRLSPSDIGHQQGSAYIAKVPPPPRHALFRRSVDAIGPPASKARLFEDDRPLGPSHTPHFFIRDPGHGRFSDGNGQLYFSASDNTDPRSNGRIYTLQDRSYLGPKAHGWVALIVGSGLAALWVQKLLFGETARGAPGLAVLTQPATRRALRSAAVLAFGAVTCVVVLSFLSGVPFWMAAFLCIVFGLLGLRHLLLVAGLMRGAAWKLSWFLNLALAVASVGICVVGFEGYLAWLESSAVRGRGPATPGIPSASLSLPQVASPVQVKTPDAPAPSVDPGARPAAIQLPQQLIEEITRRRRLLSLPSGWEIKHVEVAGATGAYEWHGAMHVHDENDFRRLDGPFPKKRADTMRVMVVGDSMTYGDGIREEWTYTAQLERAMRKDYRIEFFNLGVDGYQSEDVARVIERMLPELKPDLVIYGVCYNDFLPSGVHQNEDQYPFPLPERLKRFLLAQTRFARFLSDNYESVLLLLGLSRDFYDDILKDFDGYQKRFAVDVRRMNHFVRSRGLPPIVGMTLNQFVKLGGRGHRISRIAEKLMREAGFEVVSAEGYYRQFDGQNFGVSRWESHPDEEANAIFAEMLYVALTERADVQRFSIAPGKAR